MSKPKIQFDYVIHNGDKYVNVIIDGKLLVDEYTQEPWKLREKVGDYTLLPVTALLMALEDLGAVELLGIP